MLSPPPYKPFSSPSCFCSLSSCSSCFSSSSVNCPTSSSSSRLVLHSHPDSEAIPIPSWHRLLHHDVMLSEWPGPSSRWHSPRPLLPPSPRSVTSHVTEPRRRQLPVVQNFVITPVVTKGATGVTVKGNLWRRPPAANHARDAPTHCCDSLAGVCYD